MRLKISKMSDTHKIPCCLIYSAHKKAKKLSVFLKKKNKKKNPLNSNKMKEKRNL